MQNEPIWLTVADVDAIHADQLARFGGAPGLNSLAMLESAVAAPLNHFFYGDRPSLLRLASVLAHAIVKDHPFIDGNKRTATMAMLEFLYLNGLTLDIEDNAASQPLAAAMEDLAAGAVTAEAFSERLRPFLVAIQRSTGVTPAAPPPSSPP